MTSKLCNFIKANPNWKELLVEKGILIKNKDNLYIFNYRLLPMIDKSQEETVTRPVDFTDPVVQESRGIILEIKDEPKVVCWPFRKFGNFQESYADTIDWSTAKVQEKLDGSIVKLYYYNNQWNWSTNGNIDANDSPLDTNGYTTFANLIKSATNYQDVMEADLDKDCTYIFELVSPHKTIVIKYALTELIHIGSRNNVTGQEFDIDLGIKKPKQYKANSLAECITLVESLNDTNALSHEGFVVVDDNFNRIKVKSPEYLLWHHRITNEHLSKKDAISIILSGNMDSFISDFPHHKSEMLYYAWKISELTDDMNTAIAYARILYEEYSHDRKAVVAALHDNKLSFVALRAMDNDKDIPTLLGIKYHKFFNQYITDYKKN